MSPAIMTHNALFITSHVTAMELLKLDSESPMTVFTRRSFYLVVFFRPKQFGGSSSG